MDLTKAMEFFEEIKERFQNHQSYFSEFRTRILLIDPVLRLLGWAVENPDLVELEYQPAESNRKSADYVLKNNGKNVAIVEAKNTDKKIGDLKYREQADDYARYAEVKFFVLTNGVTWLLYERDLMTSLESLKPIVRFDVVHDEPHQCALAAISMWRPNLASDSGPSAATKPVFISPEPALDRPSSKSNETPEQQQLDDSPENSGNWCNFERKLHPRGTKPDKLKIGDSLGETVTNWKAVIRKVITWLADEEMLNANDCPIGTETYTFIGTEGVNPNGTPLRNPKTLSNGLILQRGYVNTIAQWQKLRQLLGDLGVNRDTIRVSYEPTGKDSS